METSPDTELVSNNLLSTDTYVGRGNIERIGQIEVYSVADLTITTPSRGLLLLLPDGFGLANHNIILADNFSQEGFHVILPDYFEGEE